MEIDNGILDDLANEFSSNFEFFTLENKQYNERPFKLHEGVKDNKVFFPLDFKEIEISEIKENKVKILIKIELIGDDEYKDLDKLLQKVFVKLKEKLDNKIILRFIDFQITEIVGKYRKVKITFKKLDDEKYD